MNIIGFDFSINKPAACVYINRNYIFYSWPFDLSDKLKTVYRNAGVNLQNRFDIKYKGTDSTLKMRWEVKNAQYLSKLIISDLLPFINNETIIAFEGLSYGSSGNMGIQLGGYKYILMNALSQLISIDNMWTYAPITIKKTAGCSKKGQTKSDLIDSFITNYYGDSSLRQALKNNTSEFKKKTGTWIEHLDDLIDSFFVVETYKSKELYN